jgi:hypothetical protein
MNISTRIYDDFKEHNVLMRNDLHDCCVAALDADLLRNVKMNIIFSEENNGRFREPTISHVNLRDWLQEIKL